MSGKIKAAEAALHDLEQHKHAAKTAHFKMKRAERMMGEFADDPEELKAHQEAFNRHAAEKAAAEKAHADSGVTPRDIDKAAQAVLDARGEGHTETNILPPSHGIRTVNAENALAVAISTGNDAAIQEAQAALDEARAGDEQSKAAHVQASYERTVSGVSQ